MKFDSQHDCFFSVVIPTLNEEAALPLLLNDLSKQTFRDFEVVHVDGQSDDKTLAQAEKFKKNLKICTVTTKKHNVSYQRNIGANHAKGKWILFMDADNRLPTFFLEGVKYQLAKHPDTDLFSTWVDIHSQRKADQIIEQVINTGFEIYKAIGKPVAFGAMIGARKNLTHTIKFNEDTKVFEDGLFISEASKHGYIFRMFSDPRYVYSMRRNEKEGDLKYLRSVAAINFKYLRGDDFKDEDIYPMLGGSYYQAGSNQAGRTQKFLGDVASYIKTSSKHNLERAKRIFRKVIAEDQD